MSHNAHFFRIKADTAKQALESVNGYVDDGFEFISDVDYGEPIGLLDVDGGLYENLSGSEGWNKEDWFTAERMATYLGIDPVTELKKCETRYKGSWCEEELTDVERPMGKASKVFVVVYDFHS